MNSKPSRRIKAQVAMALLVSLATALHVVEGLMPPLPLPGARLGLANVATLVALRTLGFGGGVGVSILRSMLGGLLSGSLLGPGFWMGFFGAVSSALVMSASVAVKPRGSNALASVLGAVAHSTAQIITAVKLMHYPGLWGYWPFLTLASGVTGWFVGLVSDRSLALTKGWLTSREGVV